MESPLWVFVAFFVGWLVWRVWTVLRKHRPWRRHALRCVGCGRYIRDLTREERWRLKNEEDYDLVAACHPRHMGPPSGDWFWV